MMLVSLPLGNQSYWVCRGREGRGEEREEGKREGRGREEGGKREGRGGERRGEKKRLDGSVGIILGHRRRQGGEEGRRGFFFSVPVFVFCSRANLPRSSGK
jgi:hypothetical protein